MKITKLLIFLAFITFFAGLATAGCESSMIASTVPADGQLTMDINWDTPLGSAFGTKENGFIVPVDSTMIIKNIGTYTTHCEDGDNKVVKPPLRITVQDAMTGFYDTNFLPTSPGRTYWCSSGCTPAYACGAGIAIASQDPMNAYVFSQEGVFDVNINFASAAVSPEKVPEEEWRQAIPDFNVTVFSPLIAVHGYRTVLLPFKTGEQTDTRIIWTVQNLSSIQLKLKSIQTPACESIQDLNCGNFENFTQGLAVEPGSFVLLNQTITLNPQAGFQPADFNLFLDVNYTDPQGVMEFTKRSEPTLIKAKPVSQQKFNIKIKGAESNICYGLNGKIGYTGENALPKIKQPLSWSWNDISLTECDKNFEIGGTYHYCDSVQFSIEVLRRLHRIDSISTSLTPVTSNDAEELQKMKNFTVALMKDGFSKDLQEDLSTYLTTQPLAEVDTWFRNFKTLFTDNSKFKILLAADKEHLAQARQLNSDNSQMPMLETPGIYEVQISVKYYDLSLQSFILSATPNSDINVYLIKASSPVQDSLFYYLPIDGSVGYDDTTKTYDRDGYGTSFTGKDLVLISQGTQAITMLAKGGTALKTVNTAEDSSFAFLNEDENRGSVLTITADTPDSFTLTLSPSNATPVLMRVKQGSWSNNASQTGSEASAFYYIRSEATADNPTGTIIADYPQLSYWTGIASNMRSARNSGICQDFTAQRLFNKKADSKSATSGTGGNCNPAGGTLASQLYGFSWPNIQQSSDQNFLYLQGVFYTPKNSDYKIYNGCDDKDYELTAPTGDKQIYKGSATAELPLDYGSEIPELTFESVQNILDALKNQHLCLTSSKDSADFWWNEEKLFTTLEQTANADAEFSANKCGIKAFQNPAS